MWELLRETAGMDEYIKIASPLEVIKSEPFPQCL
jgi:hypothetical protein